MAELLNSSPAPADPPAPASGAPVGAAPKPAAPAGQTGGPQTPAGPQVPPNTSYNDYLKAFGVNPPPAPVYNRPPTANPGSYGGYNPAGAPLLGIPYSQLINPANNYSAPSGLAGQTTSPGSAYGDGYGYATMQYNHGAWQQVGFGYGNQSPTSTQALGNLGTGTRIEGQGQNVAKTDGGFIFGGNGQL